MPEILNLPFEQERAFDPIRLQDRSPVGDMQAFPPSPHPYYIVAPPYTRQSAGIKALHILCHALNRAGYEAYVVVYPNHLGLGLGTNPDLLTPCLTAADLKRHRDHNLSPIVVYAETIKGNPFSAKTVVRYVLNFPGLLGGDAAYPADEIIFGYSRVLAEAGGAPDNVLFVPASDATVFTPIENQERSGTCFWAAKYVAVHNGELLPVTAHSVEITRERRDSQTIPEIVELFRKSELFYTYENTALALEAAMCLCPTVFLPTPWLTEVIATKELGWDGFAWGTDPDEIARAKATVHLARQRYLTTYTKFWTDLSKFAQKTQARAAEDATYHPTFWKLRCSLALRKLVGPWGRFLLAILQQTTTRLCRDGVSITLRRIQRWPGKKLKQRS